MSQYKLFKIIDKAVFDYQMIEKGDRILVGASGGKDSTALVEYFARRAKRPDADFSFSAIHIETDFETCTMSPHLRSLLDEWGVDTINYFVDVKNRLKDGFKMSCYWCSNQRRNELVHFAVKNGYNKIALGHHLDDILETLLMNMMEKSRLFTMPPRIDYKSYNLSLIRPLCYASVDTIKAHAKKSGYISTTCTCMYQNNSSRKLARSRLQALTNGDVRLKEKMFESLRNINPQYLP